MPNQSKLKPHDKIYIWKGGVKRMYLVNVWTFYPYKKEGYYRVPAGSFAVATNRAIKLFRQESFIKGKKFKELFVKAVKAN